MSQKENKKKYLEEYRVTLRIFESVFYKSLIRACSFDNFLAASQNARSYGQTINHRALRICKKRIQKVLMLSPFILINISSLVLSDSYMQHYLQIRILPWKYNRDLCSFSHFTFYFHLCMMEFCSVFYNG